MAHSAETTLPSTRRPRRSGGGAGRENATVDIGKAMSPSKDRKKSRSKSMGPGGLDVLKSGTGNRRVSMAASARPAPRSILKPTISQLQEIPPHKPKQGVSARDENSHAAEAADENAAHGTRVAVRTEEEQQAAAREREEREGALAEKEANDRREARRKSLANRRVSFAAEATLHTFHEIEYLHDSTTSTDSTRRASSLAAQSPAPATAQHHGSEISGTPIAPPEQAEETIPESPANQRGLHQKRRRRSSGADSVGLRDADSDTSHATSYDSDSGDEVLEVQEEEGSDASSDSDEEDGTMMTVEAEEMTSASVASAVSARTSSSANSTADLDDNLRLAEERARTGQLEFNGAASPQHDDNEEEVIPAFTGWIKRPSSNSAGNTSHSESPRTRRHSARDDADETVDMEMEMDLTDDTGGIIQSGMAAMERGGEEDMSMDVTSALGRIIAQPLSQAHGQSVIANTHPSDNDDTILGDKTMDLTTAVGTIKSARSSNASEFDGNEDMSMELTTAIGGVLGTAMRSKLPSSSSRRSMAAKTNVGMEDDAPMDVTTSVGRILPSATHTADAGGDATIGMDMTMPLGRIIKPTSPARRRSTAAGRPARQETAPATALPKAKEIDERDQNNPQTPGFSPFRGKGLRRSPVSDGAAPPANNASSAKIQTPTKTPPSKMIGSRSNSPKRPLTPSQSMPAKSPSKLGSSAGALFTRDPVTGAKTAKVVLTPQRRLSGVGADRSGLGSPKVAEILDRRSSLGDSATAFVPGQDAGALRRKVAFEDPRSLEEELDRERRADQEKESGRGILEREADGSSEERDVTLNLKEMIQNLSPKKDAARGRKSLHVGSAKGLLGKRPAELDEDDEDDREDRDGVKRLKNHQGSPVKNVKLPIPPSKAETTGRITRAGRKKSAGLSDESTTTPTLTVSIQNGSRMAASPKDQGRFRDVEDDQLSTTINFAGHHALDNQAALRDGDDGQEQRIHLQDFLNMTNIRFLELTTTKRRHTVAPGTAVEGSAGEDDGDLSLERCVVAGACTVPMLELYQHSCRELKNYISEGRRIVKEIETEAFEENPPLFQEYLSASPEFKAVMDNQFKNVKAHARLLSKAMWYEWRMKLQDGLKEGLVRIMEGMDGDEKTLQRQQKLLNHVLPGLVQQLESLETECEDLERVAKELADSDPEELQAARSELVSLDADLEAKRRAIAELEQQLQETEAAVGALKEQKQATVEDIVASEKVREECRGWTSGEVAALKAKAESIEKQHGWAITGIVGTAISMTYLREVELVFDVSAFQPQSPQGNPPSNTPIDLWYIGANRERNPQPLTPEKDFMLECIRDHVRALAQSAPTGASSILGAVSAAWQKAQTLARQLRLLNTSFRTAVTRTSDTSLAVTAAMLLPSLQTKVDAVLDVHARWSAVEGVDVAVVPRAAVVYGEAFNAAKMSEFLAARMGPTLRATAMEEKNQGEGRGAHGSDGPVDNLWVDALLELQTKLLARGKKSTAI